MSVEIQWTDTDPVTGARRTVRVERFAGKWTFLARAKRFDSWAAPAVTRDMWETLLDAIERRLPRREGVTELDVVAVKKVLANLKERPPKAVSEEVSEGASEA